MFLGRCFRMCWRDDLSAGRGRVELALDGPQNVQHRLIQDFRFETHKLAKTTSKVFEFTK